MNCSLVDLRRDSPTRQHRFHRSEISRDPFRTRHGGALTVKRTVLAQSASCRTACLRLGDSVLLVVSHSERTHHTPRATYCRRCFGQRPPKSSLFVTRSSRFEPSRIWTLSFAYLSLNTQAWWNPNTVILLNHLSWLPSRRIGSRRLVLVRLLRCRSEPTLTRLLLV